MTRPPSEEIVQTLSKGANASLAADVITVQIACSSPVDVSALLLDHTDRVRSDADMVFYNQPTGPGVAHATGTAGAAATVRLTLAEVPANIQRVVVAASLDELGPASFGVVARLEARLVDASGTKLVEFLVGGLSTERAVVCVEVYRRAGTWKVRAVGQGHASGLAELATSFGVTVDDAPSAPRHDGPAAAATAPPAAPARTVADTAVNTVARTATGTGATAPDLHRPARTAPPTRMPTAPDLHRPARAAPPTRMPTAPDLRHPARTPPAAGAPVAALPPSSGASTAPPPSGAPAAFPPPPGVAGGGVAGGGVVNLDAGPVSLCKQQSVSLVKTGSTPLRMVRMGLGWAPVTRGSDVDLDASVIAFDVRGRDVDRVWYGNLQAFNGAVQHSGDNLSGAGEGDDEVITVGLDALPADVEALVFTVNSFRGQTFAELASAYCRLLDEHGVELVRYDLGATQPRTGVLLAKLVREADGTWSMTAIGEFHDARNVKKMVDPARAVLGWR